MCDEIQQKYKYSDAPSVHQSWQKGQACVAFYEKDETWHRASVLDVHPDKVQVGWHSMAYFHSFDMC